MQWEKVLITEETGIKSLERLCVGRAPTDFLVTESSAKYRKLWKQVVASLQLEQFNYLPYSLRRGGATSAYRQGATLDELLLKGRWKHVATARLYLDQGLQEFTNLALPPTSLPAIRAARQAFCACVSQQGTRGGGGKAQRL